MGDDQLVQQCSCGGLYIHRDASPDGHGFCTNFDCHRSWRAKRRRYGGGRRAEPLTGLPLSPPPLVPFRVT